MNEPPLLPATPPAPPRRGWIAAGFGAGVLLAGLVFIGNGRPYGGIPFLVFDLFAVPVIALILAIIPKTRPFGLGLLLACGLGWITMLCLCSGMRF